MGLAQGLTDETFVLNSRILKEVAGEEQRRRIMLGINSGAYASWVIFTILGGLIGKWLPVQFSGFQFALLALFIILTASSLSRKNLMTYILAGTLAVIFKLLLPGKIYLILSVALAALVIPELVTPGGSTIVLNNPYLWAGIFTFLFARRVPNLFLGILFGMVVYWGCDKLLLVFH